MIWSNPASLAKQEWGKIHKLFLGEKKRENKYSSFTESLPGDFTVEEHIDSKVDPRCLFGQLTFTYLTQHPARWGSLVLL